jgi:hypothetical protein
MAPEIAKPKMTKKANTVRIVFFIISSLIENYQKIIMQHISVNYK